VNAILRATARMHYFSGAESLSIKTFTGGRALYRVGGGFHAVTDETYLLLNHGQHYEIEIDAPTPITSFCLFFAPGFVEEVARNSSLPAERLLDSPEGIPSAPLHLYERTYPHDDVLTPALRRLRDASAALRGDPLWCEEQMHHIAARLLQAHARTRCEAESLPALRAATRDELYRRLWLARDYADAFLERPVTLDEMAQVACLSPNHLLRTFRAAFGVTPHQYLVSRRLDRAKSLLAYTDNPVTEISVAVGYQSLGTFSREFAARVGLSPSAFRRAAKR
jgi:AraC-like DNA-binding protein